MRTVVCGVLVILALLPAQMAVAPGGRDLCVDAGRVPPVVFDDSCYFGHCVLNPDECWPLPTPPSTGSLWGIVERVCRTGDGGCIERATGLLEEPGPQCSLEACLKGLDRGGRLLP